MQSLPPAAFDAPVLLYFAERVFESMDFFLHTTAVHFELLLARTA